MGWFHKTLTDMKVLIEIELKKPVDQRDWDKVKEVLSEHEKLCSNTDGDLTGAKMSIVSYERALGNVRALVNKKKLVGWDAEGIVSECDKAIAEAKSFEDAIKRLIADEKFLEES